MSDRAEAIHGVVIVDGGIVHANHHSAIGRVRAAMTMVRALQLFIGFWEVEELRWSE